VDLVIRAVRLDELREVSLILAEGAERIAEAGHTLWNPEELTPESLRPSVTAGEWFVVLSDQKRVATFRLQWEDPVFWPEMPAGEAAYLHKIAVKKSARGQGVTRAILDWSRSRVREKGGSFLRLDTDAKRTRLCEYYESLGFARHSFRELDWIRVIRFQMKI
jgi:GNAT superfamily N-acetyltransferase